MANKNIKTHYLTVKDYSVSGEEFQLIHNAEFDYLLTHPQPASEHLQDYYKSEDYISHTDSKRNLFEKIYHIVKRRALNRKLKLINTYANKNKTLLDVGCGTGDFLKVAQKNTWTVSGIEPNAKARQIANLKTDNAVFDIHQLSTWKKERFDVITLWHVLEHLPKVRDQILVFKQLLAPDGTLIIAVPNYKSYDAKFYNNHWAAFDVPRHLWHFSRTSIKRLMAQEGMEIISTHPLLYDAFYVSLLSEKYKTGNMNVPRAMLVGALSNIRAMGSKEYSSVIYVIKKK